MSGTVDIERHAVRAVLLNPDEEVLLLRIHSPADGEPFWITPGGGLEAGETPEAGLRRELAEELGLTDFAFGPVLWLRQHTFNWAGKRIRQREQYHVVHVDAFDPIMADEMEARSLDRFQWWRVPDLEHSPERLTPLSLFTIVTDYIAHGPPIGPLTVEVLVD